MKTLIRSVKTNNVPSAASLPEYFDMVHDRLMLQHNEMASKLWHKDVEGNLKKADANWPTLSQQKPPTSKAAKE
jgi:hypothetical protein